MSVKYFIFSAGHHQQNKGSVTRFSGHGKTLSSTVKNDIYVAAHCRTCISRHQHTFFANVMTQACVR